MTEGKMKCKVIWNLPNDGAPSAQWLKGYDD